MKIWRPRSPTMMHLHRCGAGEPATSSRPAEPHLAAKGEFKLSATTTQHLCRSLLVAKCLGATGDCSSAGSASAGSGAVRRSCPDSVMELEPYIAVSMPNAVGLIAVTVKTEAQVCRARCLRQVPISLVSRSSVGRHLLHSWLDCRCFSAE